VLAGIGEALKITGGNAAGVLIAFCGLAGVAVAAVIDPVAAAIASAALLAGLVAVFVFALRQRSQLGGPYRILDETIIWQFPSSTGNQAFLSKRQQVRFNYLAIAHLELASGDGELFASFTCNYGTRTVPIPRNSDDGLLIVLDPERTRDEECELTSRREIRDGFIGPDQWVTFRFAAPSRRSEFVIEFPDDCEVRNVRITGPTGPGSRPAKNSELRTEGAKKVLRLRPRSYRENQVVKVTWSW
jgi:hypothetical protein